MQNEINQYSKQKGNMKVIMHFANGSKSIFVFAIISAVISILLGFLTPQIMKITVDSVIGDLPVNAPVWVVNLIEIVGGREFLSSNLIVCALAVVLFYILSEFCNYLCRVSVAKTTETMTKKMRDSLYDHIQRLPYDWHVKVQTGDIIQRCTSDVELIRNFISNQLMEVFRTVFLVAIALFMMFSMNVKLSLIATAFIPVVVGYSWVFYSKISKRFKLADEAEGDLSAAVQENFTGVRVVRAFGREKFEIGKFNEKNNKFSSLWIRTGYVLGAYWGMGDLFTGLQLMAITVFGCIAAVNGVITLGEFLIFVSYNSMLVWPIRNLGRIMSEMSKMGVSLKRIKEIFAADEEQDTCEKQTPPMDRGISFENVSFSYGDDKKVLDRVNLTIQAGETIGILGPTGAGKSTLVHLITRLYDLKEGEGCIKIGGVNINDIDREWLRSHVGIVLQEAFLFSKTIKDNIAIAKHQTSLDDIRKMTQIAAVDNDIQGFDEGYDTIVGERGVTLSGGQRQRVAIARMLMKSQPITIFDDSFSAIDAETDSKIRNKLHKSIGNTTVILISHRITTLMNADKIFVLDDGKVVQSGTHQELAAQDGIYKKVLDIQQNIKEDVLKEEVVFGDGGAK